MLSGELDIISNCICMYQCMRERERVNPLFPQDERNFITINKNIYHKLSNTKLHFQEMDYLQPEGKEGKKTQINYTLR